LSAPTDKELPFDRLGDFRLLRVIGRGATGTVYEAVQESLGRRVALKVLSSTFNIDEKTVKRFHREASALARIHHRNIVPIFHVGEDRGVHFYAMELIDGKDVQSLLVRDRRFPPQDAARLVRDVALALDSAHEQGIVHRDIKPANLIVEKSGEVRVTDFGLAKIDQGATITESGTLVGTPMYMSPEQALGSTKRVDRRSDVYSLGATLYEMLTGRPIFRSDNFQAILRMIVEVDPPPPRRIDARIPRDLETIVLKAIHKKPERRYATALEFAEDLRRYCDSEPILARRTTFVERGIRRVRKHKSIVLIGLLVVVIGAILFRSIQGSRSSNYELALRKGRIELYVKNTEAAIEQFELAIELMPQQAEPHVWKGRALEELGRLDEASREHNEAVRLAPDLVEAYLARADCNLRRESILEARQDLEFVLRELDPGNAAAQAKLARILFWYQSARDPAEEDRALRLSRDVSEREDVSKEIRADALVVQGMIHLYRDDMETAVECLKAAYELDPVDPEIEKAYFKVLEFQWGADVERDKILAWMRLVNPFGAEPLAVGRTIVDPVERNLRSIQSVREGAKSFLSGILDGRDRDGFGEGVAESLSALNIVLAKIPFHYESLMERGMIFERKWEYVPAARDYETAAESEPDRIEPLYRLATIYHSAGDPKFRDVDKAIDYAKRAVAKQPDSVECLDLLLNIYMTSNNLDAGREFFRSFFEEHPEHPERARIERRLAEARPPSRPGPPE
jgi:serine/threonine protein kinase/cytochrome c-type biogenesis protein CcmH/NrfG